MDSEQLETWLEQATLNNTSSASPEAAEVAEAAEGVEVTKVTKVAVPETDPVTAIENFVFAKVMKMAEDEEKRAENNEPAPRTARLKRKRAASEDPSETAPIASTQPDLASSPSVPTPTASMEPGLAPSTLVPAPIASTQPGLSQFSSVPAPNQLIMPSMETPSPSVEPALVPALPTVLSPALAQTQRRNRTADVSNAWRTRRLPTNPTVDPTMLSSITDPIGNGYDTGNGYGTAYGDGIANGFANADGNFNGNGSSSNGRGFTNGCVTGNGYVMDSTVNPAMLSNNINPAGDGYVLDSNVNPAMLSNNINPAGNGYGTANGYGTINRRDAVNRRGNANAHGTGNSRGSNNFNIGPNPAPFQQATQRGALHHHHRQPHTHQRPGPNITRPDNGEPGQAKRPRLNHETTAVPRTRCMATAEPTARIWNVVERMAQEIAELKEKVRHQDMMIETMQNISTSATSPTTDSA
ncbi:hypothetical protein EDB80DRAFT_871195 [Ilyonectria destructans]|nr:hypothetical protein EDB80DRAFT_871195 [Ilyonectria destructans]